MDVVAITTMLPGHYTCVLPILEELRRRGHRAAFAPAFASSAPERIGTVPVIRIPDSSEPDRESAPSGFGAGTKRAAIFLSYGPAAAASVDRLLARRRPDVLLIDPQLWGAMTAAEGSGVLWASIATDPMKFRGLGLDVRGPGFLPVNDGIGRAMLRVFREWQRAWQHRRLLALNDLRRYYGLRTLGRLDDLYSVAPLIIALTAEPFEYPRLDWPKQLVFVGPVAWEPRALALRWPEELRDRPLLLITGSSVPSRRPESAWVRTAIHAFRSTRYRVVLTVPSGIIPAELPANAMAARFVSHSSVLNEAVCVLCHGGPGITQKSLAAGVPVVVIPDGYDRYEVARRVEVSRSGIAVRGRPITQLRLRGAVERALELKPGAQRVADAFLSAGGARAAADAVEALMRHSTSVAQ